MGDLYALTRMISEVLDGFDQEKLEAVQAVPSLKERYSLEKVYANITEKIEDDELRHKKVNQKDTDFLNSRKALIKSVKSAFKKNISTEETGLEFFITVGVLRKEFYLKLLL